MNFLSEILSQISYMALPLLLAIVLHEYAHGWVANFFGDHTAKDLGRLTINPIPHVDPFGTIIVPILCLLAPGSFLVGWAKPVPVNASNLHNPRRDMAFVAAAGPAMNLLLLITSAVLLSLILSVDSTLISFEGPQSEVELSASLARTILLPLAAMAHFSIMINMILMVVNLIPIPPLDGGRILISLLPTQGILLLRKIEPYGMFILIGLFMTHSFQTALHAIYGIIMVMVLPNELLLT